MITDVMYFFISTGLCGRFCWTTEYTTNGAALRSLETPGFAGDGEISPPTIMQRRKTACCLDASPSSYAKFVGASYFVGLPPFLRLNMRQESLER